MKRKQMGVILVLFLLLFTAAPTAWAAESRPADGTGSYGTPDDVDVPYNPYRLLPVDPADVNVSAVVINVRIGCIAVVGECGITPGVTLQKAPERANLESVSLRFDSLEVNEEEEGSVLLNLSLECDGGLADVSTKEIDYLSDGQWFTVFSRERRIMLLGLIDFSERWYEPRPVVNGIHLSVPQEVFSRRGTYRMALGKSAFCTFDIDFDLET